MILCQQLLRIMKLMVILLFSVAMAASANGFSQKVTLSVDDAPIQKVFKELWKQTGFQFVYTDKTLEGARPVTIHVEDEPLDKVLELCFRQQPFTYTFSDGAFVVMKTKAVVNVASPVDISGQVLDNEGKPIAGVSVLNKTTGKGTSTNNQGRFTLYVNPGDVLVFTSIGFERMEHTVSNMATLTIVLNRSVADLNEVVVNKGYYVTSKKLNTGNVSKVTSADIEKQPVSNPLAALTGRVAGLEIIQQTGVPGGNFRVRIRGTNSIANGNDPLYVIDGVPFISTTMAFNETTVELYGNAGFTGGTSPLNAINPADIESIEVLKDADATAIYGSRGANGVILISTKKGKAGKPRVDLNVYSGTGKVTRTMDLLNPAQYREMRIESLKNGGFWPLDPAWQIYFPDLFTWDSTRYTNWQRELMGGSAHNTDAQFSYSGGDKSTRFTVGSGYHKETTVFPGSNSDRRISVHFSLDNVSPNQKLRTSLSVKYSVNNTDLLARDLTVDALTTPPNAPPLYNSNGDLNWGTIAGTDSWVYPTSIHPLSYLRTRYEGATKNLLMNASVSYTIIHGLDATISTGYSDVRMDAITTKPKSASPPTVVVDNSSNFATSNFRNWTIEPQLNWKQAIGKGKLDILIGMTFLEQLQEGLAQTTSGYTSEALMRNMAAASSRTAATNYYSQYRYNAGFGRINYVLLDKYIINITGRRDGSSRFGAGRQFANFGAAGAAWLFSNESFIRKALPFISFGKLRASYGIAGNDQLNNYQYLDSYAPSGTYPAQGGTVTGLTPARSANPDFAWETNKKLEAGMEFGLLHDRIEGSVSYYRNRSSNQLVGEPLPPTTGFTTVQSNFPAVVQNTGFEIELSVKNIRRSDLEWSTALNFSIPRNKLVAFPGLEASNSYASKLVIGQPLSILKRYIYTGVNAQTGFYEFKDINGDGFISSADQQGIAFVGQKFSGGLQNSIRYMGLQLDIFFQFVRQTGSNYVGAFSYPGGDMMNQPAWIMDRWQKPGDISGTQIFSVLASAANTYEMLKKSTGSISDASFIRLKNLSLSWSLPKPWIQQLHAQTVRIFIQGQNLLTITSYKGLDPETGNNSLPPLRILAGGFQLTF